MICGYGYAAVSTDLLISGDADVKATNIFQIETMQEMTPEICAAAETFATAQLIDERDDKTYWVTRLPDGKCWMAQNIDYDGGGNRYYSGRNMSGWVDDAYEVSKQYYYTGDNDKGHESIGSYYSYASAMSVCPSGWKLPTGGAGGDYDTLLSGINMGQALSEPYYFVLGGYVGEGNRPAQVGILANYRSSQTPSDNSLYTMVLYNNSIHTLSPDARDDASSVRCVVGEQEPIKEDIYIIKYMQDLTTAPIFVKIP